MPPQAQPKTFVVKDNGIEIPIKLTTIPAHSKNKTRERYIIHKSDVTLNHLIIYLGKDTALDFMLKGLNDELLYRQRHSLTKFERQLLNNFKPTKPYTWQRLAQELIDATKDGDILRMEFLSKIMAIKVRRFKK